MVTEFSKFYKKKLAGIFEGASKLRGNFDQRIITVKKLVSVSFARITVRSYYIDKTFFKCKLIKIRFEILELKNLWKGFDLLFLMKNHSIGKGQSSYE